MSEVKSLRKKKKEKKSKTGDKLQISAPLPAGLAAATISSSGRQTNDSNRSEKPFDTPRERPQKPNRTADLVKRRYSQKSTTLPNDFSNVEPMPAMPRIPPQFKDPGWNADQKSSSAPEPRGVKLDPRALQDPSLRPDQFVNEVLAEASEEDIRRFQDTLQKAKNRASTDLQMNVYQNRTQFIKISKEAEKLKGEMRMLRQLMTELTSTLGQTTSGSNPYGDSIAVRKASNRNSVANLEALWNTQLHQLWKRIEGSQKYLPATQGRHVVWESRKWVELNPATWKARRRVHLILLNDHLLVAAEKKYRTETAQASREKKAATLEWIAQRCWPLQEVQLADLAAKGRSGIQENKSSTAKNAINVRVGSESCTYAAYPGEETDKITLLSTYRKAVEDLRRNQEVETEERDRSQDSYNYFTTRDPSILKKKDLMEKLTENSTFKRTSVFVDVDGKQQSIRSVESQLDELDIDIALQRFESALQKVEKLKILSKNIRSNATAQSIVAFKVDKRANKLANELIQQLIANNSWLTWVKQHVAWIVRLGYEDRAREAYLEARGILIKTRSRQCIFDGNLPDYIFQISFIYFTIIKNTVDIFQRCFSQVLMSACVKWAKEHVDAFNILLQRQLSSMDECTQVWQECMKQAREHAAMLKEVGLDFSELVGKSIEEEQTRPIGLGLTS